MTLLVPAVVVVFLALKELHICSGKPSSITTAVDVYVDTILEVNGESRVPPVFGITAYDSSGDFATASGQEFLLQNNIDTVGLGDILGYVLPHGSNVSLNTSELLMWLKSGSALAMYKTSNEYKLLSERWLEKAGVKPFIFLKNPDGSCTPHCEAEQCLPTAGTPKALNGSTVAEQFQWWSTLFAGFFSFVMEADPTVDLVHIWNEPNAHFYKDGKSGDYYAAFYFAIASVLKKQWPHVKLGGPVTWDPPNGPVGGPNRLDYFSTWDRYTVPLINATITAGLLDFIDFHAYDTDATASALQSAIETVYAYTSLHYNKPLQSSITETNLRLLSYPTARCVHYYNRTFSLILSTLALMQHPEKINSRLFFDYKANNPNCYCGFVTDSSKPTPDAEVYSILGKLSKGIFLYINYSLTPENNTVQSQCKCSDDANIVGGRVVAVAAIVDKNTTIALVNTCNCSMTINLKFHGTSEKNVNVLSSWAAIVDATSLRTATAPKWPVDDVDLPPLSLMVASYDVLSDPKNTLKQVTILPMNSSLIMSKIAVDIPCHYKVPLTFNTKYIMMTKPEKVSLRLSIMGKPGLQEWQISYMCEENSSLFLSEEVEVDITSPGMYTQVQLPCFPARNAEGVASVMLTSLTCTDNLQRLNQDQYRASYEECAYFAFASLLFETRYSI